MQENDLRQRVALEVTKGVLDGMQERVRAAHDEQKSYEKINKNDAYNFKLASIADARNNWRTHEAKNASKQNKSVFEKRSAAPDLKGLGIMDSKLNMSVERLDGLAKL